MYLGKPAALAALAAAGPMSDAPPPLPEPGSVGADDAPAKRRRGGGCGPLKRCANKVLEILDMTSLQTVQYIFFLIVFQSLVATFRNGNERYFTKFIEDTFTDNTFYDIRRIADVYEWMNTVMVPGLFSNADTGEAWPDGDGPFHLEGQTPYTTRELVDATNTIGLQAFVIKTVRASDTTTECFHGFMCMDDTATSLGNSTSYKWPTATTLAPDSRLLNFTLANELYAAELGSGAALEAGSGSGASSPAQTAPGAPLTTFKWLTTEALGASPVGLFTAHTNSLRVFPNDGFAAIFIPFFSNTFLPYERGSWSTVTDFRLFRATPRNGREALYYCARYTLDGTEVVQGCNTNPGRNDALVRGLMTQMLTELKKGHFMDMRTRLISLHLHLVNQHSGIAFTVKYMFEFTNLKGVLPSFDIETLIFDEETLHGMQMWLMLALACTCWFCMLELVELTQAGCMSYFVNIWNVIDWANFIIFFQAFALWAQMILTHWRDTKLEEDEADGPPYECGSAICDQFGYFDPHEKMSLAREAKFYTAFCITLQLLKIIKFTNVIVPKMSLMTRVLGKGATDLFFFGIIFFISVFAFTMLLFIQLGTFMDDFTSQEIALLGLVRALFGDFSFEEIMDNSRGYTNAVMFLVYLFVSVFILLSMFLAILGESQAAAREEEAEQKKKGEFTDYGTVGEVVAWAKSKSWKFVLKLRKKGGDEGDGGDEGGEDDEDEEEDEDIATMKAAILMMQSKLEDKIKARVNTLEGTLLKRIAQLETTALARRKLRQQAQCRSSSTSPGLARRNSCGSRGASQTGSGVCGCSTDSPRRRGPSPANEKAAGGSRPNMSASRRSKSPNNCGTCSGREVKEANAEKMGNLPSCGSRNKEKANLQKSHPGRTYEREWSKMKSAARVVEATDHIAKKKNRAGKEYVVDDDFEA